MLEISQDIRYAPVASREGDRECKKCEGSTSRVSDPYPETLLSKKTIGREWWIDVDSINRFSNT